jgi:hypothetical protein
MDNADRSVFHEAPLATAQGDGFRSSIRVISFDPM